MVARGRLLGALTLGPKASGDAYAPDESASIARVAASVAGSLDLMDTGSRRDQILERLDDLTKMVAALSDPNWKSKLI
jgi:hypothetical protein